MSASPVVSPVASPVAAALPAGTPAEVAAPRSLPQPPPPDSAEARVAAFAADASASVLSLGGLGLRSLPPALCALPPSAAARLTRLDLAHNALTVLPDSLPDALPNLRVLFLLGNMFAEVPECLRRCAALRMLSFKNCQLAELAADRLPPGLTWLILTSNRLHRLPPDFGARTSAVVKLMLSNNMLDSAGLPPDFIPPACELLRLNNNRLSTVPPAVFAAPNLAWLGLGGNPCTTPPGGRGVADLDPAARAPLSVYDLEATPTLGSGASGDVYRATDRSTGAAVAVKVYRAAETSDGSVVDEMRASLALRGAGLIPVRAFFAEDDGRIGLVMDLVEGMREVGGTPSFDSISRDVYSGTRFNSLCEAETVVRAAATAAAAMHARKYAHGDLYGHNLLENAAAGSCYLTDLGASFPYEDQRIEKIEVRAFGILVEELVHATAPAESSKAEERRVQLLQLADCCMNRPLEERPTFAEIFARL